MDEKKRQRVFFGVIAIATLIIAMIGTTIAFFTATSTGTENAVSATSDVISISYTDSNVLTANALIPSSLSVVKLGYASKGKDKVQCVDDNGREICSVYSFTVTNSGQSDKEFSGKLTVAENKFTNLKYVVYKQGENTPIYEGSAFGDVGTTVSMFGETDSIPNTQTVARGADNTYDVVVYLAESGTANDVEQGKSFKATASVLVDGGDNITGAIAGE